MKNKTLRMFVTALNRRLSEIGPVQLAAESKVTRNQIYRISRGLNSPTLDTFAKLAKALDLEIVVKEK